MGTRGFKRVLLTPPGTLRARELETLKARGLETLKALAALDSQNFSISEDSERWKPSEYGEKSVKFNNQGVVGFVISTN